MHRAFLILALLGLPLVAQGAPPELVLVQPGMVNESAAQLWKKEGFKGVVIVLDETTPRGRYEETARTVAQAALDVHCWIEVGRNPRLAEAHPRWMASLGVHDDWQARVPKAPKPKAGEVAKAYPWVPIWYQDAFDAQLQRVKNLLEAAPPGWRSVFLNDLQGAPSSCGCGNLQCRWATDYRVPATSRRLAGDDVPARFVSAVQRHIGPRVVVPVWVTECEHDDLPLDKRSDGKTTGLCGTVGCALSLCPKEYTKQWAALLQAHSGPVGLLGLHRELERDRSGHDPGPAWLTNAVRYLNEIPPQHQSRALPQDRLWLVVQGYDIPDEPSARRLAASLPASVVIVARTRLDQSFEPRILQIKP